MQAFEAAPPPLALAEDGVIRVAGTRVQLETVVTAFDAGATAEEIVQQYPALDLRATYAIISYVLANREAVDSYMAKREQVSAEVRRGIESQQPPDGIRARLLARRTQAGSE
jgi:uncharacterized protein (DUF433 family)